MNYFLLFLIGINMVMAQTDPGDLAREFEARVRELEKLVKENNDAINKITKRSEDGNKRTAEVSALDPRLIDCKMSKDSSQIECKGKIYILQVNENPNSIVNDSRNSNNTKGPSQKSPSPQSRRSGGRQ